MAIHLISVLGTSLYEPVIYRDEKNGYQSKDKTEFIQMVFIEQYMEELKNGGKVTIFLTKKSKSDNWLNRKYKDHEIDKRIKQGLLDEFNIGEKIGLKQQLEDKYPDFIDDINIVDIPDGKSEDEIWSIFEKIFNVIDENDELIMDITHSFRSIPLLGITVLNYAKVLKNCSIKGIYYGAYEAKEKDTSVAPIFDLTLYNEILEWTAASESFMYSGNMRQINDLMKSVKRKSASDIQRKLSGISKIIDAMNRVSESVDTSRGADMEALHVKADPRRSIKNAYSDLRKKIDVADMDNAKEVKPLYPLLGKASERYEKYFNVSKNYEVGLGVVKWSIDHNMTQQGYTALEESIKTFLCCYYGIDDSKEATRDGIMGYILNSINVYMVENRFNPNEFKGDRNLILKSIFECNTGFGKSDEWHEKNDGLVERVVKTIDLRLVDLTSKVKNYRNDINHFGFRENPTPTSKLITHLTEYYETMMSIVKCMNERVQGEE